MFPLLSTAKSQIPPQKRKRARKNNRKEQGEKKFSTGIAFCPCILPGNQYGAGGSVGGGLWNSQLLVWLCFEFFGDSKAARKKPLGHVFWELPGCEWMIPFAGSHRRSPLLSLSFSLRIEKSTRITTPSKERSKLIWGQTFMYVL
jgi:hypothetical protein